MTLYIIIPYYNAQNYISEALNSLTCYCDMGELQVKLVLVDDGSTDQSYEICYRLCAGNENVYHIRQANKGVSAARNEGLQYVYANCNKNDYIGFCDADDLWREGWTHIVNEAVKNHCADIIGFGQIATNEKLEQIQSVVPNKSVIEGGYDACVRHNRVMSFGAYLYKAGLCETNRIYFPIGVANGEDLIFKYKAFYLAETITYIGEPLYVYRMHSSQVTNNYSCLAERHYSTLLEGWYELQRFAKDIKAKTKKKDIDRLIEFSKERIFCTCIYAARDFCLKGNGSFCEFQKFLDQFIKIHIDKGKAPQLLDISNEYNTLMKYPFLFYVKYTSKRIICVLMKRR